MTDAEKAELIRARGVLALDLIEAEKSLEDCLLAGKPYENVFWTAHYALKDALAKQDETDPPELRPFYDDRLMAGHEAHPYRQAVREAKYWVKSIVKELSDIDRQLSAADCAMMRPKGKRTVQSLLL